ncbi:restriction endonuclease [Streptomyces verrucosisporus]|uniref:restriction endonuclease n=1 Tax=Streptomyces verrucosisporus TaxID=1695161 RepID=UPI0019D06CBB|nr:restriction endonuclease [Streptomyces verrucosisporus]MBN3933016.1 restriction endonuclease [Streptomyces verrucosisporus]
MAAGEGKRVRAGGALLAEFKQLGALPSAHKRGYQLEVLLEQLFRRAHFQVDRNASVAKPRQTDLVARYGDTWYLIEAKWHNEPADINVFDSVRSRMERAASSAVIGVIISVNGFTDSAVEDLRVRRDRGPILLFGEEELTQVLSTPRSLVNLLQAKREELITHGRVHLAAAPKPRRRRRPATGLPGTEVRLLGLDLQPLPYVTSGGGFGEFVFVPELPDVDWAFGSGSGVSLDVPVRPHNEDGIVELLYGLDSMGWTTTEPQWNIQQSSANWHGTGAREFVEALRAWKNREDTLKSAHHTEQVTYFDTCQGGGFYTLTASIASHRSRAVYDCRLSFQLPGVPVDLQPIQHLFEQFDAATFSYFRPLNSPAVVRHHPGQKAPLETVGYVVSHSELDLPDCDGASEEWVTGLVVRNPRRGENRRSASDEWPGRVAESELLICALRSHHQLHEPKETYHLCSWEYACTSDALALRPVADW